MAVSRQASLSAVKKAKQQSAYLLKAENAVAREVNVHLTGTRKALVELLAGRDPTAVTRGWTSARIAALSRDANDLLTAEYASLSATVRARLVEIGSTVGDNALATLRVLGDLAGSKKNFTGVGPTRALLHSIITTNPIQGAPLSQWWQTQKRGTQVAFRREITLGMSRNESLSQLVGRVAGNADSTGIMTISTRNAEAIVRTAVNQIANQAALETYKAAGAKFTEQFEFVATLDERTTEECEGFDGTVWNYDDPEAPIPPLHVNCRSTIIPVINYEALDIPAPVEEDRQTVSEWRDAQGLPDRTND